MPSIKRTLKPNPTSKSTRTRLTIGMLVDWIDDQYQLDLFYGINDLAIKKDINLLCFEGGTIHAKNEFEASRNKVYDLVSPENVDGLIILSAVIGQITNLDTLKRYKKNHQPLPVVLVGHKAPGISSILVENNGLRELMLHLINVHQYKRFVFIKGHESNPDASERYSIFENILTEQQIPVDQQLIVQGDFSYNSGVEAVRTLLDQRRAVFDVVVACNDDMAAGALIELKTRGIKVPEEIAVTGFDNLMIGRMISPPLTTVGYSIYELGRRAAEILVEQLEHKTAPMLEPISTQFIIRNSCGCINRHNSFFHHELPPGLKKDPTKPQTSLQIDRTKIIAEIVQNIYDLFFDNKQVNLTAITTQLLTAFEEEFAGTNEGAFFKAWDEVLDSNFRIHGDISPWQTLMSELRNHLLPYYRQRDLLFKAEDLFQQARMLISEKAFKTELYIHNETIQINGSLSYLREHLLAAVDEDKSMDLLAHTLPGLGIKSCYITMFEGKTQQKSRLILAYDEHGRTDKQGHKRFFPNQLLPENIFTKRRSTMLVVALNSIKPQLGYALFEMGTHDGRTYSELRRIICGTIQVATFFRKIQEQANRLSIQKEHLSKNIHQLRRVMTGFIQAIALTVESRDPYTAGHQHRVADLACAIAIEMNLTPEQIECIQMAGIIHDLGKIYIPAEILNKPGRLSELEFTFIKNHPEVAFDIIEKIEFPWPLDKIILQHHERMDGSGYPFGLRGRDIKLEARILTVADVVEAMTSHRPYRSAFSLEKALGEIDEKRGLLYDDNVVEECLKLFHNKGFQFKDYSV